MGISQVSATASVNALEKNSFSFPRKVFFSLSAALAPGYQLVLHISYSLELLMCWKILVLALYLVF